MGLFSSKTKHYTSSSVWNLAGDFKDRPDMVRSVMLSSMLTRQEGGLARSLLNTAASPAGTRLKTFFRWARDNYEYGMPTGSLNVGQELATAAIAAPLAAHLGLQPNQSLSLLAARIGEIHLDYWAEQWLADNRPELLDEAWEALYEPVYGDIHISFGDETMSFPVPADFLWAVAINDRKLLYVSYQIITQGADGLWDQGPQRLFTYRMGTGNRAFDGLVSQIATVPEFYPALPIRLHNTSMKRFGAQQQKSISTAFRKLTGGEVNDVVDKIDKHANVGDMDHVLVVPSISLNTKDQAGLAYLYQFFSDMALSRETETIRTQWQNQRQAMAMRDAERARWFDANMRLGPQYMTPLTGELPPLSEISFATLGREKSLTIQMNRMMEFRFQIRWLAVEETIHMGNACVVKNPRPAPLKPGQYMSAALTPVRSTGIAQFFKAAQNSFGLVNWEQIAICHQLDKYRYRKLTIAGLNHKNFIYGDMGTSISGVEALQDGEDSGFLVPLHYPSVQRMGLVRGLELTNCSVHLLINSHVAKKQKWYQRGIFKVLLVIVSIVISVFTGPAGFAATSGLLGTNAAVGAAIGLTGATAMIVGAAANAIAGMVLTTILSKASVKLLGEKWGAILGTILSFTAMQYAAGTFGGGAPGDFSLANLMRPDKLLDVTKALGSAYTQWLNADTAEIMAQMQDASVQYKEQLDAVKEQARDILGMTNLVIDPMLMTDAVEQFRESSDSFLSRTLLTGSDLAELSHELISSFADITLELPGKI